MASAVIILTLCLSDACHDIQIPLDGVSVIGCQTVAQSAIAIVLEGHPGYTVSKWRCVELDEHEL